jgi:predicted lipoprotein with Yx(FWY)xxD motif
LLAVAAIVIAGCGGGDSTSGGAYGGKSGGGKSNSTSETTPGAKASASAGVVSAAEVGGLGTILVDSSGRTLYDFHKDQGTTSSCYGACAGAWPPLLTEGEPEAEGGAGAAKLGTTKRKDGTTQVTYAGHPLYTYVGDQGPGEANGNDIDQFGAEWYALQPSGEEPED